MRSKTIRAGSRKKTCVERAMRIKTVGEGSRITVVKLWEPKDFGCRRIVAGIVIHDHLLHEGLTTTLTLTELRELGEACVQIADEMEKGNG